MPVPKQHFDPGAPDPDESQLKDPFQRIVARQLILINTCLWELRNSVGNLARWACVGRACLAASRGARLRVSCYIPSVRQALGGF